MKPGYPCAVCCDGGQRDTGQHGESEEGRLLLQLACLLQALAIETAETCAEWLHRRIREDGGFPDPPELTMAQRSSRYRRERYSFGYPTCPNLEDQTGIRKLLQPQEIGVQLTESFMMDPEAGVGALGFLPPDCTYFSMGNAANS